MEVKLINLNRPLFTVDPDTTFAKKRNVREGLLNELYNRWFIKGEFMEYLQEYFEVRSGGKKIDRKNLGLWLRRVWVYKRAQHAPEATTCTPEFFGEHGEFVLKELSKRGNK